jgi:integrase
MVSFRRNRDRQPKLTHHRASGQGVVRLNGKDVYCGPYGTPECRARYLRALADWEAADRRAAGKPAADLTAGSGPSSPADVTINEMLVGYLGFADNYYIKNGQLTSEPGNIRLAIRPLKEMFGGIPAAEFSPPRLKAVREAFIGAGLCRTEINRRVRLIVRAFKWAVGEGMVPPSVHHGLRAVDGLRKGRCGVRESEPVRPVPDAFVDAVLSRVSRQLAAMIRLQRLTGMRPGEVTIMRTIDVDTSGRVWVYTPESHKTEHHDRQRRVHLGPAAQEILGPWLRTELTAYLFQPREAMAEHRAERRRNRKTRVQPSQRDRRKRDPKRVLGDRYNARSYGHAVAKACDKAGVPRWAPNQLRHNAATRLRREFGLETAKAVLGHASVAPTQVYAEQDEARAIEAMGRVG